jgi:hypothetical protein
MVLAVFPLTPLGTIFALAILVPGALVAWVVNKASNKIKLMQAEKLEKQLAETEKHRADTETASWDNRLRVAQLSSELEQPAEEDNVTQPAVKHSNK